jgi:Tol biopolymer transport system component
LTLTSGTRLGPYEILAPLGAGGMGEVYRAKDTRLDRTVAIKVLPAQLSSDPDRRARFEREARAVAALQHPHICSLFDVGHQDGVDFLVMEYLEGETLAARLERGALPIEQVLRFGAEIADALDKAHRGGIVHRDLKPANVMLTKSGVKLLDFGLAKLKPAASDEGPTRTHLTSEGMLVGTLPYMAPEQVEGKEADARTDVWAFGALLYEMATGKPAFSGRSQASLIGAILRDEPKPITSVKPLAPPGLDRLVRTCLAKDPDERWQSAHDIVAELRWLAEGGPTSASAPERPVASGRGRRLPWLVAVACLLSIAIVSVTRFRRARLFEETSGWGTVRFAVPPPARGAVVGTPALSPDGRRLAFVASDGDRVVVWVRGLDSLAARRLAGTDGASPNAPPFWSPDGRHLAFFAGGKLKRIDAAGGSVQALADAPEGRGGSWSVQGVILFAPGTTGPLLRVPAAGGTPSPATELDKARQEFSHRWPHALPDGVRFIYWVEAGADPDSLALGEAGREIQVGSLDAKGVLARFPSAHSSMAYAPPGYVLFQRDHLVVAQAFDPRTLRLSGEPAVVAEGAATSTGQGMPFGAPAFSVSQNGALAFRAAARTERRLAWFDRDGRPLGVLGPAASYRNHRLSPDGTRAAVAQVDPQSEKSDIWILDASRPAPRRLTFDPVSATMPVWSPDGSRIVFDSERKPDPGLYQKEASGAGREERPFPGSKAGFPLDWSLDGEHLAVLFSQPETRGNIATIPRSGAEQPLLATPADEVQAQFSPDGRWIAYCSDEAGRYEIYVRPFPSSGGRWQVSTAGGYEPRWRRDGKELFYLSADEKMMAVPLRAGATFEAGPPVVLFEAPVDGSLQGWANSNNYDVTADGHRFLINAPIDKSPASPLVVVLDWQAGLAR